MLALFPLLTIAIANSVIQDVCLYGNKRTYDLLGELPDVTKCGENNKPYISRPLLTAGSFELLCSDSNRTAAPMLLGSAGKMLEGLPRAIQRDEKILAFKKDCRKLFIIAKDPNLQYLNSSKVQVRFTLAVSPCVKEGQITLKQYPSTTVVDVSPQAGTVIQLDSDLFDVPHFGKGNQEIVRVEFPDWQKIASAGLVDQDIVVVIKELKVVVCQQQGQA